MDEVTELAENNAALEAEETNSVEAIEATEAQDNTTGNQDAASATENAASEASQSEAAQGDVADAPAAESETPEASLPTRDADGFSVTASDEGLQRKHVPGG